MEYDVIISGGGPAGLSAGLYSARALKNTLIIESSAVGGQIMDTSEVQNLPGSVEDTSSFAIASRMEIKVIAHFTDTTHQMIMQVANLTQ